MFNIPAAVLDVLGFVILVTLVSSHCKIRKPIINPRFAWVTVVVRVSVC